jgi:hypothetical protein
MALLAPGGLGAAAASGVAWPLPMTPPPDHTGTLQPAAAGLDRALLRRFARTALVNVGREYPHKLDHVLQNDADLLPPRTLHPLFHGSYDWHSCVHMHWLLVRLLVLVPDIEEGAEIVAMLDARLTPETVGGELDYLARPATGTFERPYGWAWLLALDAALLELDNAGRVPGAELWAAALAPLARAFADRFRGFLARAPWPIRSGTHANTAFALDLALEYAQRHPDAALATLVQDTAVAWYRDDTRCPIAYEPSAEDFLSPGLMETALMLRVLPGRERGLWLNAFLPDWTDAGIGRWLAPVEVPDRSDARFVHLDGLNLSRAWCWRRVAAALAIEDERRAIAERAAQRHLEASLSQSVGSDYVAEHWLATFALLALAA